MPDGCRDWFAALGNPCAAQALEGVLETPVRIAARFPVGPNKKIVRVEMERLRQWLAGILFRHQLGNAINQNVLVIDRSQAPNAGGNFHSHVFVLISQHAGIRFRR